jgi:hypothetical protein
LALKIPDGGRAPVDVSRALGIREIRVPYDSEIVLCVPAVEAASEPLLSIVIPAMDEEAVIGEFLDWCREGIDEVGIAAEIIIVDSSSDRTGDTPLPRMHASSGHPIADSGAPISTRFPSYAAGMCSWGTPTAPMIFAN